MGGEKSLNSWLIIFLFGAFLVSLLLTGLVIQFTRARGILDIPNDRSSHTTATPKGGGLAVVITFLCGICIMYFCGMLSINFTMAICGSGIFIAGIGWFDDCKGLSVKLRIIVHFVAAVWALYWLGGLSSIELGFTRIDVHIIGTILTVIGVVWLINLYNFMDGIDGIAGAEAICVGVIGGIILMLSGNLNLATVSLALAAACVGFLVWNWPPAKIFMGDVGSGFLGLVFAVLAIASESAGALPLLGWIVLLGVFIVDATLTLIRRIARGEKWYEAHCSHAYQRGNQLGYSHGQVTKWVIGINVLLGMSVYFAYMYPQFLFLASCIILGMLVVLQQVIISYYETRAENKKPVQLGKQNINVASYGTKEQENIVNTKHTKYI